MVNDDKVLIIIALTVVTLALVAAKMPDLAKALKRTKLIELKKGDKNGSQGVIFGLKGKNKVLYSPTDSEGSIGVFSASGTGKTSAVAIPTLRAWTGTSFVIDISGDICKNCPTMPNKLIFSLSDPEHSIKYNLFAPIDKLQTVEQKNEALAQLAFLIIPDKAKSDDNAAYFTGNGRNILIAALIAFYHKKMDFVDICKTIVSSSTIDLFKQIAETENEAAQLYINAFKGVNEKNVAGCKQVADDAVKLFATNADIKRLVMRSRSEDVALTPDKIEENNIFVIIDDSKLSLFAPLLNIITSQFMQYISTRQVDENSRQILLLLDEYASLKLSADMILEALRKYRKRRCRIMVLTQNLTDLDILYGHETTRALLANMRFKVLLGGLGEVESQKFFAELIGYKKTKKRSVSKNGQSQTVTESEEKEYIIEPAELDRLGNHLILIAPEGFFKIRKNFYFK